YLKARWRNPFQQQASRPEAFHLGDGGTRQVTMMHNRASFAYQETEKWQSVALPYSGSEFVLWLILPKNGVSIDAVLEEFSRNHDEAAAGGTQTLVDLGLPKFRAEFKADLNDSLDRLGVRRAFEPDAADFSGITRSGTRLHISKVLHQ